MSAHGSNLPTKSARRTGPSPTSASSSNGDLSLATTLFTELERELAANPRLVGNLTALFCVKVTRRGVRKGEWYLLFRGQEHAPLVSTVMPQLPLPHRAHDGGIAEGSVAAATAAAVSAELGLLATNPLSLSSAANPASGGGSPGSGDASGSKVASGQPGKLPVVLIDIDQRDLFNFFSGGLNTYKAISSGKVRVAGDLVVAMALEEVFRKAGGVEKTLSYLRMYEQRKGKAKL
ncbi:hypothetical protein H9P43_003855 [Blastocladiella emersonii ATCC 22665]|nr:hypothetical protein H9P43_003855 [Blastocladiella emersonii ATCC 22665]